MASTISYNLTSSTLARTTLSRSPRMNGNILFPLVFRVALLPSETNLAISEKIRAFCTITFFICELFIIPHFGYRFGANLCSLLIGKTLHIPAGNTRDNLLQGGISAIRKTLLPGKARTACHNGCV